MRLSSEEASMSSAEIIPCRSEVKDEEEEVKEDGDSSFDHAKPSKYGAIVEEAIRETEIRELACIFKTVKKSLIILARQNKL